jgi:hypothetical protein
VSYRVPRLAAVTDTETPALPDEDRFAFPEGWNRYVRPRRGNDKPKLRRADVEAGRKLLVDQDAHVRERLAIAADGHGDAGRAFLDGEADLLGAAVVMALVRTSSSLDYVHLPVFDVIAADHGLPFAAAAFAEFLLVEFKQDDRDGSTYLVPQSLQTHRLSRFGGSDEFDAVRSHLAALPEPEYAAVVAGFAPHRADPLHRFVVSVLLPSETAWLDEVCAEHLAQQPNSYLSLMLLQTVTTREQLDSAGLAGMPYHWFRIGDVADLLDRLGSGALPVLQSMFRRGHGTDERKILYKALAAVPDDAAMDLILDNLDDAAAMPFAMEAAARFPQRTLRTVAARLPGAEPAAVKRFTTLLHSDPVVLGPALAAQDDAVRATVEDATGAADRLPAAPADALPALLASPPWDATSPETSPVVLKGLTPPAINRVVWREGEREAWAEAESGLRGYQLDRDFAEMAKDFAKVPSHLQDDVLAMAPPELAAPHVADWKPTGHIGEGLGRRILANHGDAAAEPIAIAAGLNASLRGLLLPIANLTAARLAADTLVRLKTMRPLAFEWLDRHPADAAALLVPDALSKTKKPRAAAEAALRYLAASGHADTVRAAAAQYGPEAAAALEALADADPLAPAVQLPAVGPWVSPPVLPQVLLPGRQLALPDTAIRAVATVLALGSPDYEYAGVAVLAETCDRASLTRFSLALFEQWLIAGAPWDESWALMQLMHFGDDDTVRALAPLIGRWPGENQHHRAVKGLQVLGAIGSEAALRAIQGIGEKAKFAAIKQEAREQITAIAANLGLSAEQLADRLVPDFGLREESALVLDYGPRRFKVGFDEQLKPFVTDADGKPRKSLPKPAAKDDADLADAAYKRFANLRKELRTVAADQVKRLERAMVAGRTWTPAEFREYFAEHPLVWHLARRLVWSADDGTGAVSFRLAEDRTPTDVGENELVLAEHAAVRIAHPVHLGKEVAAWSEVFADYEIVQPFEQLVRPVCAFTEEELRTGVLARFEGVTVPAGAILGLVKRGWTRSAPQDAGCEPGVWIRLGGAGYIVIALDPGLYAGEFDASGDQTLQQARLSEQDLEGWRYPKVKTDFGPVDPAVASEALVSLAKLVESAV